MEEGELARFAIEYKTRTCRAGAAANSVPPVPPPSLVYLSYNGYVPVGLSGEMTTDKYRTGKGERNILVS